VTRRGRLWVAVALVAVAFGVLVGYGSKNLTEYYLTIPQFEARKSTLVGQRFRLAGELVGRSVRFDAKHTLLTFTLRGGNHRVQVVYHGVQPDDFQADVTAIVDGTYLGHGVFRASQVLVQCPSHYAPAKAGPKA